MTVRKEDNLSAQKSYIASSLQYNFDEELIARTKPPLLEFHRASSLNCKRWVAVNWINEKTCA